MAVPVDDILDKFILVAQAALPTELSLIGVNEDLPAVIRARQTGTKPSYPYVTIDCLEIVDESGWLTLETLSANDEPQYETNKQLLLNYRVYGGNAISIAQRLHGYFRSNRVRGDIITTLGGSVVTVDDVDQLPILLTDTYLESASFNIIFNITDTFIDTDDGSFDTINVGGTLYNISVEDANPQDIDVTVPVP